MASSRVAARVVPALAAMSSTAVAIAGVTLIVQVTDRADSPSGLRPAPGARLRLGTSNPGELGLDCREPGPNARRLGFESSPTMIRIRWSAV